jgi:nickel-type superoxide dismutase maturation protease
MLPTLEAGDTVWVDCRAYRESLPDVGDLVVARHPFQADQLLIKRVAAVEVEGRIFLRGDNPDESTDSRGLGALEGSRLIGQVIGRTPATRRLP